MMPIQSHSQYGGRRSQWEIARQRTRFMIQVTMLCAIQVVMMVVPFLGFIPLGPINATTLHLPVVVAGTVLGVKGGAI
ncbi:MAG: ECF transporter S component, partial [Turicibacter sp.]|nr:ECF transporter S component [Turicibacter sp.]